MIPLTLKVQNFLSYGPTIQTIDFKAYKLICLSGKNGHGKSALLDAITWAIWGQARKTSNTAKADQGVLRLGQVEMMCSIDFICNQQTYRIRRVFSTKYGKPSAHVDFGTLNPETDSFIPLTEKTIRKTQEVINQTLGIDYESFINSSFLRQGQANEFSKKTPKDRKEVLAAILGLTKYEKARKLATEEAKQRSSESEYAKKLALHIAQECDAIPSLEVRAATITTTLTEVQLHQTSLERLVQELTTRKEQISQQQQQVAAVAKDCIRLEEDLMQMRTRWNDLVKQWKQTHAELLKLPADHTIADQKKNVLQRVTAIKDQLATYTEHRTSYTACLETEQQTIQAITATHTAQVHKETITIERLKYTVTTHRMQEKKLLETKSILEKELAELEAGINTLKTQVPAHFLITDTAELQTKFERYKLFYQRWIDAGNIANNELKHVADKKKLLHDNENPSCPLCEQNVSQARKRFLIKNLQESDGFYVHRFNKLKRLITWIKAIITEQHGVLEASKKIDALLQEQAKKKSALETLEQELVAIHKQIETALEEHKSGEQKILELQHALAAMIASDPTYQQLQVTKNNFKKILQDEAGILQEQEKLTAALQELQRQESMLLVATKERRLQRERRTMIHDLAVTLRERKRTLSEHQKTAAQAKDYQQVLQEVTGQEQTQRHALTQVITQRQTLLQEQGACAHALEKLTAQRQQQKKYEIQAEELLQEAHEYSAVAHAFSKDGIQALLIEDALPEIENEANNILSKLTDNQTHIFIESLRDLKKGGTKETLDINISDSNGIRPYEMFSGGEAFRIDFALRIAISKLLARRAGTSLQTLIIDEGFGSQDEDGLNRIMDVIYKIQDDFEKIIIVSHLAGMKDQFPVHFVIEKTGQGSTVHIRELG